MQPVIKLIQKKDKDHFLIKKWRPISFLNVNYKIIWKFFSARLKKVLSLLIFSRETAYVGNSCISESEKLISDLLDVIEQLKTKDYLGTIDIEKDFHYLDHSFFFISTIKSQYLNWHYWLDQ